MANFRLRARREGDARLAFGGLLAFAFLVYSNPGTLFFAEAGGAAGIAKAAAALALGALLSSVLLHDRRLRLGGAVGALVTGFYAWVALSSLWSIWPAMTRDTVIDGTKYLAIFFLVANVIDSRQRAIQLVHALAWYSVIPAVGELWSWSHGEHLVDGDRAAWVGIFGNPNDLAYHLVVGVALALGARELTARRWLRQAYLGGIAVMAVGILLTQSRGGLIAAATVLGLWAVRSLARGRTLITVASVVVLAIFFAPTATWQRAESIGNYEEDASAQGRIDAWRTGYNVARSLPLTGVGAGVFALSWPEYAPGDAGPARSAHNTFIQVLAETGLPALALFVGALVVAAAGLSRIAGRARSPSGARESSDDAALARTVQIAIGGFAACSLTGAQAYSWPLYLLLGLAAALLHIDHEKRGIPVGVSALSARERQVA